MAETEILTDAELDAELGSEAAPAEKAEKKPTLWERIANFVRGTVYEELDKVAAPQAETQLAVGKPHDAERKAAAAATEPGATVAPKEETVDNEKKEAPVAAAAVTALPALPPDVLQKLARVDDLEARLVKAEKRAADEAEARERQVYLEKAQSFIAIGAKTNDLAEHLYLLAKADKAQAEWWEAVLQAADNALVQAGLFNEFGTSRVPETASVVEKVEAGINAGKSAIEILKTIPRAEQEAYLAEIRRRAGK